MDGHAGRSHRITARGQPVHRSHGLAFTEGAGGFQAALSLILLSAAGLLTSVLYSLQNQNLGFDPNHRIVMSIEPRLAGYRYDQLTPLFQRICDAVSSIPGVQRVALCTYSPQYGPPWGGGVWVNGHRAPDSNSFSPVFWDRVTEDYFDATGTRILRGRGISEHDTASSSHVAVINEAFARKYFKNEDPLGKHFGREGMGSESQYEIVGVARDIRNLTDSLDKATGPFYFLPESQHDLSRDDLSNEVSPGSHFLHDIVVKTSSQCGGLPDTRLRSAMASVDPNLPVISIRRIKEQIARQFRQQRLIARLTSFFGILSLVLSCIGLYGVTAYDAGRRTGEIGVRMALGADRRSVLMLILQNAFGLILVGLLIGVPLTFAAGRFLGNQLYGMNPYDLAITSTAAVALALSALVASLLPAFRASSISPLEALRLE